MLRKRSIYNTFLESREESGSTAVASAAEVAKKFVGTLIDRNVTPILVCHT